EQPCSPHGWPLQTLSSITSNWQKPNEEGGRATSAAFSHLSPDCSRFQSFDPGLHFKSGHARGHGRVMDDISPVTAVGDLIQAVPDNVLEKAGSGFLFIFTQDLSLLF